MATRLYLSLFSGPFKIWSPILTLTVHQFLLHQLLLFALLTDILPISASSLKKASFVLYSHSNLSSGSQSAVTCLALWLLIRYHLPWSFIFLRVAFIAHWASQSHHYWYFRRFRWMNSLLWGAVPYIAGCLAASLATMHYVPAATAPSPL